MAFQLHLCNLEMPIRENDFEPGQKGFELVRDTKNKDSKEHPEGDSNGILSSRNRKSFQLRGVCIAV